MKCEICEIETEQLEVHHIIPKSRGGTDDKSNLKSICLSCHGKAHDVSFRRKPGVVSGGAQKAIKKDKEAQDWLDRNNDFVDNWLNDLYDKDYNNCIMISELISANLLNGRFIYELIVNGKANKRLYIDLNN